MNMKFLPVLLCSLLGFGHHHAHAFTIPRTTVATATKSHTFLLTPHDNHSPGMTAQSIHHRRRFQTPLSLSTSSSSSETPPAALDTEALGKYALAAGTQITALSFFLTSLDYTLANTSFDPPVWAVGGLFYILSLRSRLFNPLNNQRPNLTAASEGGSSPPKGFGDRVMPSWTPPGVFFPILWILINAPLRAAAATTVYSVTGHLSDPAVLCLMWHLTCGDVWNTINNTERRIGASVAGVATVWLSVVYAVVRFWEVDESAGRLLGLTALWITVASALVTDTWRLNPKEDGRFDPLYPVVGDVKTKFFFEK